MRAKFVSAIGKEIRIMASETIPLTTRADMANMRDGDVFYIRSTRYKFTGYRDNGAGFESTLHGEDRQGRRWTFPVTYTLEHDCRIIPASKVRRATTRTQYAFTKTYTRPIGFEHERNDCSVRALACATGQPYQQAHAYMESHGRQPRKGAFVSRAYKLWNDGVHSLREWSYMDMWKANDNGVKTLGQWLKSKRLPKRCILATTGHVIAVVDGVVMDSHKTGAGTKVVNIFEVVKNSVDNPASTPVTF